MFVGGGVIALEFTHLYARAGTKVTILEAAPQLLPRLDADLVGQITQATEELGVDIHTNVTVSAIEQDKGQMTVRYTKDGQDYRLKADKIINGAGRIPNVDTLNIEAANIQLNQGRIEVDPYLRAVDNPAIWVVGDALATTPQLSYVATHEDAQWATISFTAQKKPWIIAPSHLGFLQFQRWEWLA